jgi:hypothetical protein
VSWLGIPGTVGYMAGIVAAAFVTWALVTGRLSEDTSAHAGWGLCSGALFGGLVLASAATPDWSPLTIFALWLPFFAFAAWALHFSLLKRSEIGVRVAARRALFRTVPTLLLAPVVLVALLAFRIATG